MKYNIICDLHLGAPNQLIKRATWNWEDESLIFLGDNFDLANCKKDHISSMLTEIDRARYYCGWRFKTGNHERARDEDTLTKIPNTKVGIMHGDLIFWGEKRSKEYRSKPHGAGFLKRNLWVNTLEALENGYDRKIKTEDLERFYEIAVKNDVEQIIVGHLHPKVMINLEYKKKKLIVLPRGITSIEIK